jgi:NTP pyrophosphatase (non-canonical NTP hydrolase)
MHFSEYQDLAMRTRGKYSGYKDQLLAACLGMAGETGEFIDSVKKMIYHNKPIPTLDLQKELGDGMWYNALACDALGFNMDTVAGTNIEKLKARYPDGFSFEAANKARTD